MGEQAWDGARLVARIGGAEEDAMGVACGHSTFAARGSRCRLALLEGRAGRRGPGMDPNPALVDALHRGMLLWKRDKRGEPPAYLGERVPLDDGPLGKLAQAHSEVLPRDPDACKSVGALRGERPTLRAEGKCTACRQRQANVGFSEDA